MLTSVSHWTQRFPCMERSDCWRGMICIVHLDQSGLFAHPGVDFEGAVQLFVAMRHHVTRAEQLLVFGDSRRKDGIDEQAVFEEQFPGRERAHVVADEDRDDRRNRIADIETQPPHFMAHALSDLIDALDALRLLMHDM